MITGPFAVACTLLAVGGAAKAWRPGDTARALALFGWPVGSRAVRLGGMAELALAAGALMTAAPALAGMVGLSYVAFAVWVSVALRRGLPISSCGCFGTPDAPPSVVHVVLNLAAAAAAFAATAVRVPPLIDTLRDQPAGGLPFVALAGLVTWMAIALLETWPGSVRRAG